MPRTEHYQKLERMYLASNINQQLYPSISIQIAEGRAEISLKIKPSYFHALGALHGSVYFKLLDDAAFFAVSSQINDFFILTTRFQINLLRPVSDGKLTAIGTLKSITGNLFEADSRLLNEEGKELALGSGSFVKSKIALTGKIGYR